MQSQEECFRVPDMHESTRIMWGVWYGGGGPVVSTYSS